MTWVMFLTPFLTLLLELFDYFSIRSLIDLLISIKCYLSSYKLLFCLPSWRLFGEINCFYYVVYERLSLKPCPYYFFSFSWVPTVLRVPWVMMPTRWQRASAYSIMWVVRKRDLFYWHFAKTYHICRLLSGSNPVEG